MSPADFFRTFQNSPEFANLALHAWLAAWLVTAASANHPPSHVAAVAVALAALKEFVFDRYVEIPAQPPGSIRGGGSLQDFTGYVAGISLGAATHFLTT
jgi:hypothetical protein